LRVELPDLFRIAAYAHTKDLHRVPVRKFEKARRDLPAGESRVLQPRATRPFFGQAELLRVWR
jgi:hypothetical protein